MNDKRFTSLILIVAVMSTASITNAMSITGLGSLPGGSSFSRAQGISGDGSTVVGFASSSNGSEAFLWTQAGGMVGLGDLDGGSFQSDASGVSTDGTIVVGEGRTAVNDEAFSWTQSGGMVGLGDLPGISTVSRANDVSSDGSAVAGDGYGSNGPEAFRWTQSDGMTGLGDLPGGIFHSKAQGISADGSIVVGYSSATSGWEAFLWTESGGMLGLGDLPGGSSSSLARGVSADGSTVVGHSEGTNGSEAFVWTQSGGMVGLGDLPSGSFASLAWAVSGDGSTVVGYGNGANGSEAFVWDASNGMRSLKTVLEDGGVDMTGWTLTEARGVSDDGQTIVGYGTHNGNAEAFVAIIADPPGEIGVTGAGGPISDGGTANFGNHAVGMNKVRTFQISNDATGDATSLSDFSITKDGADAAAFTVGAISAESLGNGQSTTFRVTFTPSSVGSHSAAIHVASNDEDESPFDINLTGTGLANSDSEPGSDAWETANGFSPTIQDYYTRDSDGDGIPDIREIYFGWPRYFNFPFQALGAVNATEEPDEGQDFFNVHTSSNGVLKVQYRRSTTQTALIANPVWTSNLTSNDWKYSGENDLGAVVAVSETVVSNGVGFEIVEASAEVISGNSDSLFFSLELLPNE